MLGKWFGGKKDTFEGEEEFCEVDSLSKLVKNDTFRVSFSLLPEISDRTFTVTDKHIYRLKAGSNETVSVLTAESKGFQIRASEYKINEQKYVKIDRLIEPEVVGQLFIHDDKNDIRDLMSEEVTALFKIERGDLNGLDALESWTDEVYSFPDNRGSAGYRSHANFGHFDDNSAEALTTYFMLGKGREVGFTIDHFDSEEVGFYLSHITSLDQIEEMIHQVK